MRFTTGAVTMIALLSFLMGAVTAVMILLV